MELFDKLCSLIIRPERHTYRISELGKQWVTSGPRNFVIGNYKVERKDFECTVEGNKVYGSLYRPNAGEQRTCVLYLHSNSGSRVEGSNIKDLLLLQG